MENRLFAVIASLFLFSIPSKTFADDSWRVSATLKVPSPGLVQSVLPPGLVFAGDRTGVSLKNARIHSSNPPLDFQLFGPDGNPRPVELFWQKIRKKVTKNLTADQVTLTSKKGYTWEAVSPENLKIEKMSIHIAETGAVGKVSVYALGPGGWVSLAKNAAIFPGEEGMKTEIHFIPEVFRRFRLFFSGYDQKYDDTPVPIKKVEVSGRTLEKTHAGEKIEPVFEISEKEGLVEIRTFLPGAGLWVRSMKMASQTPFKGSWQIGYDAYVNGVEEFRLVEKGVSTEISGAPQHFEIPIDRLWPSRRIVLKLNPLGGFMGKIYNLTSFCRVPRVVFFADQAGVYTARSGTGVRVPILAEPTDPDRTVKHHVVFSGINVNDDWRPENIVETYGVQGGPFFADGYQWRGEVQVPQEGFYRLDVSRDASLDDNPASIRIVRSETQIPYFWGRPKRAMEKLFPEKQYDKTANRTVWNVTLPRASIWWTDLRMTSSGIFERDVKIEIPRTGSRSWRLWKTKVWRGLSDRPSRLTINMKDFPNDEKKFRVVVEHGDNYPLEISKIEIGYPEKALMFIATSPGPFQVFGGNPDAAPANYDLELVRHHLAGEKPEIIELGEIQPYRANLWNFHLKKIFVDKGWGLYSVLVAVSLLLLFIVAKLFPKTGEPVN